MSMTEEQKQQFIKLAIGIELLSKLGFEHAQQATLPQKLKRINPTGSTAMRDSIAVGIKVLLQIYEILGKLGTCDYWQFVHIVLTDGTDNASKIEFEQLGGLMYIIGQTLKVSQLKTYLIGVDLQSDEQAIKELLALRILGGENCEIKTTESMNIAEIFRDIQITIQRERQMLIMQNESQIFAAGMERPVLKVEQINYIVLFNLDISGSMEGTRWDTVCRCVQEMTNKLGKGDMIGCIIFNEQCQLLHPNEPLKITNQSNQSNSSNNSKNSDSCCCNIF